MALVTKPTEKLARRHDIATRYLHGETQQHIAHELGLTQGRISQELKVIRAAWLAASVRDFDAIKSEQLAKLDAVEVAAWGAWARSQEDFESTLQEQNDGKLKVSRKREGQAGDPRFLQTILNCVERRCHLLGLDAAKRFTIDWDNLTDIQMERIARGEPVLTVLAEPMPPLLPAPTPEPEPLAETA